MLRAGEVTGGLSFAGLGVPSLGCFIPSAAGAIACRRGRVAQVAPGDGVADALLPLVRGTFPLIGRTFSLIGQSLSLVSNLVSIVGETLSSIRHDLSHF